MRRAVESKVPEYSQGTTSSMAGYPSLDNHYEKLMKPYHPPAGPMAPYTWMGRDHVTGYGGHYSNAGGTHFYRGAHRFQPGSAVEACYQGVKWFPGKVLGHNPDGTYSILYDDGDFEYVHPGHVRQPSKFSSSDDTDSSVSDEPSHQLSGRKKKTTRESRAKKRKPSKNHNPRHSQTGSQNDTESNSDGSIENSGNQSESVLEEGARVEALYNGTRWERGRLESISRRRSSRPQAVVRFDHGDRQRVPLSDVRTPAPYPAKNSLKLKRRGKHSKFARHMKVMARARGSKRWMRARVTDVFPNGRYAVLFDNEHYEHNLEEKFIMLANDEDTTDASTDTDEPTKKNSALKVKAGLEIMARLNHTWRRATVVRVHRNGNVDVEDRQGRRYRDLPSNLVKNSKTSKKSKREKVKKSDSGTSDDDQRQKCVVTFPLFLFIVFSHAHSFGIVPIGNLPREVSIERTECFCAVPTATFIPIGSKATRQILMTILTVRMNPS